MNELDITKSLSQDASIRLETYVDNNHYRYSGVQKIQLHVRNGFQNRYENDWGEETPCNPEEKASVILTKQELIEFKELLETLIPLLED